MKTRSVVSAAVLVLGCAESSVTDPSDVIGVTWHLRSLQRVARHGEALVPRSPAGMLRFVP